jgi:3-methyladenine DNA glycosylase AlkD
MKKAEVIALLKENQDERGMANWKKLGNKKIKSFGIGLTQLRKIGKKIGRDQGLARQLWASNIYDAKVLGLLIDEPRKITRQQAEEQVENLEMGMLSHVFASCDATLARAPFARELAVDWIESKDKIRRRCGYLLLYELSKNKRDKALDDDFFAGYIKRIERTIHGEENWVRDAMITSMLGIGKRTPKLNKTTIKAVKAIGAVDVDYGPDNSCEPMDLMKHLTSDYLKKKFKG